MAFVAISFPVRENSFFTAPSLLSNFIFIYSLSSKTGWNGWLAYKPTRLSTFNFLVEGSKESSNLWKPPLPGDSWHPTPAKVIVLLSKYLLALTCFNPELVISKSYSAKISLLTPSLKLCVWLITVSVILTSEPASLW